jgi:hypothetical protein
MRGEWLVAGLWVLGACGPAAPPASCKTSCKLGTTQCHDSRLLGTCTQLNDGCYAFVSVPCPDGQYCDSDMNDCKAGDACSPAETLSACTRAAMNLAQCCAYNPDPTDLCETEVALGLDPLVACTHLHSITCDVLHGELLPGCCCPPNWTCEPHGTTCLQECKQAADCPKGMACDALFSSDSGVPAVHVCTLDFASCNVVPPCPQGQCLVGDLNDDHRVCATPCTNSSMCPCGQCDKWAYIDPSCGAPMACGP